MLARHPCDLRPGDTFYEFPVEHEFPWWYWSPSTTSRQPKIVWTVISITSTYIILFNSAELTVKDYDPHIFFYTVKQINVFGNP